MMTSPPPPPPPRRILPFGGGIVVVVAVVAAAAVIVVVVVVVAVRGSMLAPVNLGVFVVAVQVVTGIASLHEPPRARGKCLS